MPDLQETIKSIKEWIDDPFADDFPLGIMQNAFELLEKQDKIIEQYKKADAFLALHGWKWD